MNVKELRLRMGITQEELADKTNIPRGRIAKWEQGKGSPKSEDEKKLSEFFADSIEEVHKDGKNIPEQENRPKGGQQMASTGQLLETINLLVRQNDKLADTNRILAEKIGTIPVGGQEETQRSVDAMLQGIREFVLKLSTGIRYKSLDEARAAYRRELGDVLEKTKLRGIRDGSGSSHR